MKPTLVTGATGFLGWHVARLLLERGESVRALARPAPGGAPRTIENLAVETVTGDLTDPDSLDRAVAGCGVVYHVAADYRLWAKNPNELYRSNVDGTAHLLAAARDAGVERVVYTSTVGCIGCREGILADEAAPVSLAGMQGAYKRSKFLAEQKALEAARAGLPVVIVNPTTPVGERDLKPTPTGKIVVDFLKGKMPAFVDTGLNLVDVRDAAHGHLLACEHGLPGERYILGGENLTLAQILERLAAVTNRNAPSLRIPHAVAYAAALASTGWARLTGRPPGVPIDAVRMARKKMWVRHDKAAAALGYQPYPVDDALRRAAEWYRAQGYVE